MKILFLSVALAAIFTGFAAIYSCAAACPVLDLAATACPLFVVMLPDGTREAVPRDELARVALKARAVRLGRPDAGASSGD
jgi:hypothetical protein